MTMPVKWNTYEPAKEETVVAVTGVIDGTEKEASAEIHYKKGNSTSKRTGEKSGLFSTWTGSIERRNSLL